MIISGPTALKRAILTNLRDQTLQTQPCGIDVTLKAVFRWTGAGTLDFSNALRRSASAENVMFQPAASGSDSQASLHLPQGAYLVEFNELLDMPLDIMGHVHARSSLFRSGGLIHGGVMDSGYRGAFGALLQVVNPHGILLYKDARIAQAVFHEMGEGVGAGYAGRYQGAETVG